MNFDFTEEQEAVRDAAVGIFEGGMRQIALKTQIAKLSDLKGMKIRVPQSPLLADIYAALGADPIDKKLGEVAQALGATGAAAVDGMDANSALVRAQQFDVAGIRNIVIANTFPFPAAVVFNDNSTAYPLVCGLYSDRNKALLAFQSDEKSILQNVNNSAVTSIGVSAAASPNLTPEQRANLRIDVQPGSLVGMNGQPLTRRRSA